MRRYALLVLTMLLTACTVTSPAPATPASDSLRPTVEKAVISTDLPSTRELSATPDPTASATLDGLIDDFSRPGSGWDINASRQGSVGYENGEYVIQVDEVDFSLWANPGVEFGDVLVGVEAQLTDGSPPANMGAICRYQDVENFIYGEITSDGFYSISQMQEGDLRVLTGGGRLRPGAALRSGTQANHLQFLCAGSRFVLIVNDQLIDAIEADAPARGDVGLIAGTFEKPGARVRFDDFSAVMPPPDAELKYLPPSGTVLFSDDFSDPGSSWDVRQTDNGASGYQAGRYFIRADKPSFQLWSSPDRFFGGDVAVQATASLARGPQKSEMGVICHYRDKQNFVYGSIGADGYYAIVEVKNDQTRILTGDGRFRKSDAIPVGMESYLVRLMCRGDRYTLLVNDKEIDAATGSAFSGGDVGLLAGAFEQGGVEVLFDDFSVSVP